MSGGTKPVYGNLVYHCPGLRETLVESSFSFTVLNYPELHAGKAGVQVRREIR